MTKYIDADALKMHICIDTKHGHYAECMDGSEVEFTNREVDAMIDEMPAADVSPVVRGEWCKHGLGTHQWFCSVCEGKESAKRPYCPRCGARMESEGGT